MTDKAEQYRMARAPGGVVIGGISFERSDRDTGLIGLNGRHITESNRGHVAVPGGGFLAWASFLGRDCAHQPRRVSGGTYDGLSPFSSHPDATLASSFDVSDPSSPGVCVFDAMSEPRDRSYGWRIDRLIEDAVTGDFIESDAPNRIETDDGQSGLDDYLGHLTPCPRGDIRSCDCCRCPADDCGIKSIRHRKNKTPTYACNSEDCDAEFEEPALRPARKESEPTGD